MIGGSLKAQQSADIGIQGGAVTYFGSMKQVDYGKSIGAAGGLLGRWNFDNRLTFRFQLILGNIKAEGLDPYTNSSYSFNIFQKNKFPFQSAEGLFEFNYHKYQMGSLKKEAITPFVAVGMGILAYPVFTPTIPVSGGIKFNITKKLGGVIEVVVHKTFSDNIDNIVAPSSKSFQWSHTDYYAMAAFSLCYQMWTSKGNCKINIKNK